MQFSEPKFVFWMPAELYLWQLGLAALQSWGRGRFWRSFTVELLLLVGCCWPDVLIRREDPLPISVDSPLGWDCRRVGRCGWELPEPSNARAEFEAGCWEWNKSPPFFQRHHMLMHWMNNNPLFQKHLTIFHFCPLPTVRGGFGSSTYREHVHW